MKANTRRGVGGGLGLKHVAVSAMKDTNKSCGLSKLKKTQTCDCKTQSWQGVGSFL